jgi:hypothetical protein
MKMDEKTLNDDRTFVLLVAIQYSFFLPNNVSKILLIPRYIESFKYFDQQSYDHSNQVLTKLDNFLIDIILHN